MNPVAAIEQHVKIMADPSQAQSSHPLLYQSYTPYNPQETELQVFVSASMPENLCHAFCEEVKENIKKDFGVIKDHFPCQQGPEVTFGELAAISVEIPGQKEALETHYRGKVALIVTFTDSNGNTIKVVYKPRNVQPDKLLEDLLSDLQGKQGARRVILPIDTSRGYDGYVEGTPLNPKEDLTGQIVRLIRSPSASSKSLKTDESAKANRFLICALHIMGFEDIHDVNFILRDDGYLYFIDAECFCTKISDDLSDVFARSDLGESTSEEEDWKESSTFLADEEIPPMEQTTFGDTEDIPREIERNLYEEIKQKKRPFQESLAPIPSRLLFFPTKLYAGFTPLDGDHYWNRVVEDYFSTRPPRVSLGRRKIEINPKTVTFEELHTWYLANFLCEHGFLSSLQEEKEIDIEKVRKAVTGCFEDPNALAKIHQEVQEAKKQNLTPQDLEIPVFHFHITEHVLICDLTREKLRLKKGGNS